MRREHSSDDASIVLALIGVVLLIAVVVAIAERASHEPEYDPFLPVEDPNPFGFTSPLLNGSEPQIRVNELPQVQ